MDTQSIIPNTTETLKIRNRWYQIHYTSEKSCTIWRFDNKKGKLAAQLGPIFNCKSNHLSDGWFVFMVSQSGDAPSLTKRIWPEVKKFLDAKSAPKAEV